MFGPLPTEKDKYVEKDKYETRSDITGRLLELAGYNKTPPLFGVTLPYLSPRGFDNEKDRRAAQEEMAEEEWKKIREYDDQVNAAKEKVILRLTTFLSYGSSMPYYPPPLSLADRLLELEQNKIEEHRTYVDKYDLALSLLFALRGVSRIDKMEEIITRVATEYGLFVHKCQMTYILYGNEYDLREVVREAETNVYGLWDKAMNIYGQIPNILEKIEEELEV